MSMEIELHEVTVREVVAGYENRGEEGVRGLGGKLDIRPQYQRNFIYNDAQRDEVVRTVKKNFPLNVMYWIIRDDGTFEVMDGQQRTISICDYIKNCFSVDEYYFQSLSDKRQAAILDYKLTVYFCRGDDDDKIVWFKVVNIAGERLYEQELRNAVYAGQFVNDARAFFSQRNCAAWRIGKDYLRGEPIRQDYLETALEWLSDREGCSINNYMSKHKHGDVTELKEYFHDVINWVKRLFPNYYADMKGLDWGKYFNRYGQEYFDVEKLSRRVEELRDDEEVQSMSGIYKYLLTGEEKHLNLRAFDKRIKEVIYRRQGGKTEPNNCQMLCKACNRIKGKK